jgi:hypothetical protein
VNEAFVLFIFFLQAGWLDFYLRSNGRSRFADQELFECVTAEVSPLAKSAKPFDIAQGQLWSTPLSIAVLRICFHREEKC